MQFNKGLKLNVFKKIGGLVIFISLSILLSRVMADGPPSDSNKTNAIFNEKQNLTSTQANTVWNMPVFAIPGSDGTSLFISSGETAKFGDTDKVEAKVEIGGVRTKDGMTYNEEGGIYEITMGVFEPGSATQEGLLGLSVTTGGSTLETPNLSFRRFYVPTVSSAGFIELTNEDNNFIVRLANNSLDSDSYILLISTQTLPDVLEAGYKKISTPYSIQPAGGITTSNKMMLLEMFNVDNTIDTHTLKILQWHKPSKTWQVLNSTVFANSVISLANEFTLYMLASSPEWQDDFNDFSGLSIADLDNTTLSLSTGALILKETTPSSGTFTAPITGHATSQIITPTMPISKWHTLTYSTTNLANTQIKVDVLAPNNTVLLSNVPSGVSLAHLDPILYPALKLRATLVSSAATVTPRLYKWGLTFTPLSLSVANTSPTPLGNSTTLSANSAANNINYTWDLGDGTLASGSTITHSYNTAGIYTALVTATNQLGSITATTTVIVEEAITGFTVINNSPTAAGNRTLFTSTLNTGTPTSYTWHFGDGTIGYGQNITHTYTQAGTYTASVVASNAVSVLTATTTVRVNHYTYLPLVMK